MHAEFDQFDDGEQPQTPASNPPDDYYEQLKTKYNVKEEQTSNSAIWDKQHNMMNYSSMLDQMQKIG